MTADFLQVRQDDPARFAADLRDLASQAHRTLTNRTASSSELHQLSHRIVRLRDQMDFMISEELSDWLEKLGDRVESRYELATQQDSNVASKQAVALCSSSH